MTSFWPPGADLLESRQRPITAGSFVSIGIGLIESLFAGLK
jgi:hypothetical protein